MWQYHLKNPVNSYFFYYNKRFTSERTALKHPDYFDVQISNSWDKGIQRRTVIPYSGKIRYKSAKMAFYTIIYTDYYFTAT